MRYKVTSICTVIGIALCFIHYVGHENDLVYMIFYGLSIPAWFYPFFNYTNVNPFILYLLTVLSWAIIGYLVDRFSVYRRSQNKY